MGYYLPGPARGKVSHLIANGAARIESAPKMLADLPADKALIVVKDNGMFEAAALAYSDDELAEFTRNDDPRDTVFLLMDKAEAHRQAGFRP